MSTIRFPFLDMNAVNAPYDEEIRRAVSRVIDSGRFVGGEEVENFERELVAIIRSPHVVGVSNGLDALRLIFKAYMIKGDLKPGDEVIVPANTYIASILPLLEFGLVPVLAEPADDTLNLDTARLSEYLTAKTSAILPVHLYGRTVWDEKLVEFARANNLLIIEDNAQAIGAKSLTPGLNGSHHTGALGHAAAFSFYPTKNIGALGDAGAVSTADEELASIVRALSNYGSDRRYHNIYAGYNCRLDPIQAAVLSVKLKGLDEECVARQERAALYNQLIDNPLITKPLFAYDGTMVWHQYIIRVDRRDEFRAMLAKEGVATDIHYATPPHLQPCMSGVDHAPLPITERIADTVISLPVTRATSLNDVRTIAEVVNSLKFRV